MSWLPTLDRSWFRSRLVLVAILLLLLMAVSLVGDRGLLRLYQLHQTRAALIREIQQVSAANVVLAEEVRALRTDPGRIEAIAREELGLVKPGETVYEFRAAAPPQPSADAR
jgi:cell division protein FtsL